MDERTTEELEAECHALDLRLRTMVVQVIERWLERFECENGFQPKAIVVSPELIGPIEGWEIGGVPVFGSPLLIGVGIDGVSALGGMREAQTKPVSMGRTEFEEAAQNDFHGFASW